MRIGLASAGVAIAVGLLAASPCLDRDMTIAQRRRLPHPGVATVDISRDGRVIAFESDAALAPADTNELTDVYVLDRSTGRVTCESVSAAGGPARGTSTRPRLSGDGRFVVFQSEAPDLVATPATRVLSHVYRRDRISGETRRLSQTADGQPANGSSGAPDISDDGRLVVFHSSATNLVSHGAEDLMTSTLTEGGRQIYLSDTARRTLARISVDAASKDSSSGSSFDPAISGDGRIVAFTSTAPLDDPSTDTAHARRGRPRTPTAAVFIWDARTAASSLVSRRGAGGRPNGASFSAAVSGDGERVAFVSTATDLGPRDRSRAADVYVWDRSSGQTRLVSQTPRGRAADGPSSYPAMSAGGRFVAFTSEAADLLCERRCAETQRDVNLVSDVYVADVETGAIVRISRGDGPDEEWWEASAGAALDAAGQIVVFSSQHASSDDDDRAHDFDAFVRVLTRGPR